MVETEPIVIPQIVPRPWRPKFADARAARMVASTRQGRSVAVDIETRGIQHGAGHRYSMGCAPGQNKRGTSAPAIASRQLTRDGAVISVAP